MAVEGVDAVADGVAEKPQLHWLLSVRPVLKHGGLEVLPDDAGLGALDGKHGARRVIETGVGLGESERVEAAKLNEEVQESRGRAVDGQVGHAVAPGTEGQAGLVTDQVGLDAEIGRPAQSAADVVPLPAVVPCATCRRAHGSRRPPRW